MAPWTSRSHLARSRDDFRDAAFLSPSRLQGPPRATEADILQHAYGIPSLREPSSQPSNQSSGHGQSTSRHGRSMSHPFPSIFQSKKKREAGNSAYALDSADVDHSRLIPQSPSKTTTSKFVRVPDKDLVTGKCMTCDSMVRWPKELEVFRCTVCLTINDLKPTVDMAPGSLDKGNASTSGKQSRHLTSYPKILPLSTETTCTLIEQCVVSYLLNRLGHGGDGSEGQLESPSIPVSGRRLAEVVSGAVESVEQYAPVIVQPIHVQRRHASELDEKSSYICNYSTIPRVYSTSTPKALAEGPLGPFDSKGETSIRNTDVNMHREKVDTALSIFGPLEDYIITSFKSRECVNSSFTTIKTGAALHQVSEGTRRRMAATVDERHHRTTSQLSMMDAKTLLIGDFAENGSWWSGGREQGKGPSRSRFHRSASSTETSSPGNCIVSSKSPRIDWAELSNWYRMILCAGTDWESHLNYLTRADQGEPMHQHLSSEEKYDIEKRISEARIHTQRVLLKATESLLKRPGAPLREPNDIRFLLIILENPLLYPSRMQDVLAGYQNSSESRSENHQSTKTTVSPGLSRTNNSGPGQHSGIIKRVLGLLSNLPNECHHYLVGWFARFSESHFRENIELVGGFVTYRLARQHGREQFVTRDHTTEFIPTVSASGRETSAALHAVLGVSSQSAKKSEDRSLLVAYSDDWQLKAAARVMALLFAANISGVMPKNIERLQDPSDAISGTGFIPNVRGHHCGQIIPTSDFYNTLLDYSDLIADFEAWETRRGKFTFCQYPFFLSIWAKIRIMEHDAHRQMEIKAREAFFDSIMTRKAINQYLVLKVRRECLVEDSLKGVSEVVGTGQEEIKKGLRIEFKGEEGIDAGGLRKEWFLLLVRDVFNPEHGMFTYDEDSQLCYFNANSFETSDQFFLVGVVLGLAIYNSTILDVPFPHFAFRKLLTAGPNAPPGLPSHTKPTMTYTLDDLGEFRPGLANGLQQLLDYDGDVESTFCRDFVADVERYGQLVQIPLCPGGENRSVTNTNRREFVDLYIRYLLDGSVSRQFEPFKRGFFTVCGGNALSLFRPEEIELLIRGSDEPLDIASLRGVAIYENWGVQNPAETELVVVWFWQSFENAKPEDQRKLLSFITGSDRIPAMGAASLVIKLSCLGGNSLRFPVARTCFNMLSLWRYDSHKTLERMLWRAVGDSEGFGLK